MVWSLACVDSMDARLNIWKFVKNNPDVQLYIDSTNGGGSNAGLFG